MVMISQNPHLVNFLCDNFIDKLSPDQEASVLEYFYEQAYVNFRADFYRGPTYRDVTSHLLTKCEDPDRIKNLLF